MAGQDMTLAVIKRDDEVLLGLKKRGFGKNLWNGFGGKISDDETAEQAMIRECVEEVGLTPTDYKKVGDITFHGKDQAGIWQHKVHCYLCEQWDGQPIETDEMKPAWFKINNLPLDQMWDADGKWLPDFLAGKMLKGEVYFDQDNKVINYHLEEVSGF